MNILILDTTAKSITAVMAGAAAATNPDFTSHYADATATAFTEGGNDGVMNGTTPVTLVAAPSASTRRIIKAISIQNRDTAEVVITINLVSAGGTRQIWKGILQVGDTWTLDGVIDSNGAIKQTFTSTLYVGLTGDETVAGIKTFFSFPLTPSSSPTTDYQVANKQYVDGLISGENWWDRAGTVLSPHNAGDAVADILTYNGLTLTAAATGFTVAGGTTSKTLTVPLDASISGVNTGDNSANSLYDIGSDTQAWSAVLDAFAAGTDVTVGQGGTGVSTLALNGVLFGNAGNALGATAIGAQYQVLTVGATPFVPAFSSYLLDGTAGGKTILAVTNTKTLTLTATGDYNLTIPATGVVMLVGNSHTTLSDIGTNTHAQIDTFIGTTVPTTYLPLAGGTMVGNILMTGNKLIGGSTTTSDLYLQTTTGVGTTGADMHFLVGNNGATEAMTILNSGNVGIGTTGPTVKLDVAGQGLFTSDTYPPLRAVRTSSAQSQQNAFDILHKSTADAIDGMGSGLSFSFQDDTAGPTILANIYGQRLGGDTSGMLSFFTNNAGSNAERWRITPAGILQSSGAQSIQTSSGALSLQPTSGNVGIGTIIATNILSFGGNAARIIWSERHTTANTAGNTLTLQAGGATAGATDKAGGNLVLWPGVSTGSAESGVIIAGCVAGVSGTTDRTITTAFQVLGNRIGFFAQTPVVRQTELTDELTTVTFSSPGTPDYAIQDLVQNTGFGFVTADEGQTVLSVIANMQTRINELETKLVAYGLLLDAD